MDYFDIQFTLMLGCLCYLIAWTLHTNKELTQLKRILHKDEE